MPIQLKKQRKRNKNRVLLFALFVSFFCSNISSIAQQSPHITGDVLISTKTGQLTCNLTISQLPDIKHQYEILLNKGMNIKFFKDSTGKVLTYSGWYDGKMRRDGQIYKLGMYADTLPLPSKFYVSYTGGFPVYTDTLHSFDFKGLIAFNGKTLRAAEQSLWYPVIYDKINDRMLANVTYDLHVKCTDCSNIFMNGSDPVTSNTAQVSSSIPTPLLLFIGDYSVKKESGLTLLNTNISSAEQKVFTSIIKSIQEFYVKKLNLPYTQNLVFLEHQPIKPMHPKATWGFVTYPTFAIAGKGFNSQIDTKTNRFNDTATHKLYAHELAHYYFGTVLMPNDNLFWFFSESLAEYMSFKATEHFYGNSYRRAYMKIPEETFANSRVIPLNKITHPEQISAFYRYTYAPFLIVGLEKIVGINKIYSFLQVILNERNTKTDYEYFKQCALKSGISNAEWTQFEEEFINVTNCKDIVMKLRYDK
ncbi:M1 family aminopeptidase [Sediminibacterium sp. KACHI17]